MKRLLFIPLLFAWSLSASEYAADMHNPVSEIVRDVEQGPQVETLFGYHRHWGRPYWGRGYYASPYYYGRPYYYNRPYWRRHRFGVYF